MSNTLPWKRWTPDDLAFPTPVFEEIVMPEASTEEEEQESEPDLQQTSGDDAGSGA